MYFQNSEKADYTLTPQTAKARGYIWVCDLPDVPTDLTELEKYLKLVNEQGYMFGKAKFDNTDPSNYPNTGVYRPLKKSRKTS